MENAVFGHHGKNYNLICNILLVLPVLFVSFQQLSWLNRATADHQLVALIFHVFRTQASTQNELICIGFDEKNSPFARLY